MEKKIKADKALTEKLMQIFSCSDRMVRKALGEDGRSMLARKIRHTAIAMGAEEVWEMAAGEMLHDADGMMRQYFGRDLTLEIDKRTGDVSLKRGALVLSVWPNMPIARLETVQRIAKKIAEGTKEAARAENTTAEV